MNIGRILISGVAGTSAMTAWSILIARKENKQLREPELLGEIVSNVAKREVVRKNSNTVGWILHYFVGAAFVYGYDRIWQGKRSKATASSGIGLGGVSGLVGIGVWSQAFKLHPWPERIDKPTYYKQLFVAHLIFGIVAAFSYKHISNR